MLGSAVPASASLYTETTSATPTSPSRPSRLRGLSYLRNYTQKHLNSHSPRAEPPLLTRSTSSPVGSSDIPTVGQSFAGTSSTIAPLADRPGASTTSATVQSGENGWIPTIQGQSGLSRQSLLPTSTSIDLAPSETESGLTMTRNRAASALGPTPATETMSTTRRARTDEDTLTTSHPTTPQNFSSNSGTSKDQLPTIRFIPHVEARSARPSLHFPSISLTLKTPRSVVRVGRYSERDNVTSEGDFLPVGFKSKVVSRRHCEFWCTEGQWYVKDVKSSSGTFLNHVRLSSPGTESRPYPINDGDVVQLGIDFKGGEEVIFRCVKIRIECNRGWQKSLNNFNTSAHKRLFKGASKDKRRDSDAASTNSSECSICLNPVAPCQALFVAPCSHVWHYKCVRNLINGPNWPNFLCPNCRFNADLEADVEQPENDFWDEEIPEELLHSADDKLEIVASPEEMAPATERSRNGQQRSMRSKTDNRDTAASANITDEELTDMLHQTTLRPRTPPMSPSEGTTLLIPLSSQHETRRYSSQPINIAHADGRSASRSIEDPNARAVTPTTNTPFALATGSIADGPTTPRNDAGPFVLDGSAGRERIENGLVTQPVPELSEPGSLENS